MADFFVDKSHRNDRSFCYASALPFIYNLTPAFTAPRGGCYEQVYCFDHSLIGKTAVKASP